MQLPIINQIATCVIFCPFQVAGFLLKATTPPIFHAKFGHFLLSPVHTVDKSATVAEFSDSRHFLRQSDFSATVWIDLGVSRFKST